MSKDLNMDESRLTELVTRIESIEKRLTKLESSKTVQFAKKEPILKKSLTNDSTVATIKSETDNESFNESNIVENGLALLGSVVLLFGIIFFMSFFQNKGLPIGSILTGYLSAIVIFYSASRLKQNFERMALLFNLSSHFIIYYTTLKLYFFSSPPIIANKTLVSFLLLIVFIVKLYVANKYKRPFMAFITFILMVLTGFFINEQYFSLSLFALTGLASLYLFYKNGWYNLQFFALFAIYFAHTFWLFGNPVATGQFNHLSMAGGNIYFLYSYGIIFSLIAIVPQKGLYHDRIYLITLLFNGLLFSSVLLIDVIMFYKENYSNLFLIISIVCILYSVYLQYKKERKYAPSLFACYGFMTLSIALFGYFQLPHIYYLLALQSLLVVSMALWFRSKIIVVVNTILYLSILIVYMVAADAIGYINLIFAFVAILSARIMNWQKERLTLQTEMLRNIYLVAAFVSVLYGLYHAVPLQFVSLSWTIAALTYFVLSIILKNAKYRWMAISTFLATVFYLFFIDLAKMAMGFRVIAFLFVAIVLLGVSIYYTKKLRNKSE